MSWRTWSLFVATETVLCLTPGPAVLLVLSQGLRRGAAKALWASCAILAVNVFCFALSATGLGAILLASYNLFFAVKWIGAAYLIYLGIQTMVGKSPVLALPDANEHENAQETGNWRSFWNGVVVQASNPKAFLFFSAILPQFVDPRKAVAFQVLILGASSTFVEFFILLGYGTLAGKAVYFARQPRFATVTNRVAGSLLVGAGAGLASLARN